MRCDKASVWQNVASKPQQRIVVLKKQKNRMIIITILIYTRGLQCDGSAVMVLLNAALRFRGKLPLLML